MERENAGHIANDQKKNKTQKRQQQQNVLKLWAPRATVYVCVYVGI